MSVLLLLLVWWMNIGSPCLQAAEPDAVRFGARPDWVRVIPADLERLPPEGPARESVQHLLVDDQTLIGEPPRRYQHGVYRIVTQEALEGMSRLEVAFAPEYAQVVLHHLRVWRDGAWQDRLRDAQLAVIQQETQLWQHMFDGTQTLVAVMSDIRVGDVVSYAYTIEGFNPVFDSHYLDAHWMGWSLPTARRYLRLSWPTSRTVWLRRHGDLPAPQESVAAGLHEAVWDLHAVPTCAEEYDVPPDLDPYPWVQVSEFGTWEDVVQWALPLYAAADSPHEALRVFAQDLTAESTTPQERVLACLRWVQDDLRYFGIEMGVRSHAPHDPSTVLRRRFGDCKDKALLLVAMLRALGIQAWPALVSNGALGAVADWQPDPTVFDHVIVQVALEGRSYWMDPTLTQQGGGLQDLWIPSFQWALPIRSGIRDLVAVPTPQRPMGRSHVEYDYRVFKGRRSPALHVRSRYEGRRADMVRAWLADISQQDLQEELAARFQWSDCSPVLLRPITVEDQRDMGALLIDERYRLDRAWALDPVTGQDVMQLVTPDLFTALTVPESPRRELAFALPAGLEEVEQVRLTLPRGWELDPLELQLVNPWFQFTVQSGQREEQAWFDYALRVQADRVAPPDLPDYLQALDAMHRVEGYSLTRGSLRPPGDTGRPIWRMVLIFLVGLAAGAGIGVGATLLSLWVLRRVGASGR